MLLTVAIEPNRSVCLASKLLAADLTGHGALLSFPLLLLSDQPVPPGIRIEEECVLLIASEKLLTSKVEAKISWAGSHFSVPPSLLTIQCDNLFAIQPMPQFSSQSVPPSLPFSQ